MKNISIKLFIVATLLLVILILFPGALAESVDTAPVLFDWPTLIGEALSWLVRVLASALLALIGFFGRKYVTPWLHENRLTALAKELVRAAEARFGRKKGEEKLKQVFSWLRERGVDIDDTQVVQAVMAAWQDLDLEMIAIGVKDSQKTDTIE